MKITLTLACLLFSSWTFAQNLSAKNQEVENFLQNHEVRRVTNYCRTDFLNCRSVVQYRSKTTGQDVKSFEDRFMSSTNTRSVSFRGFFLEQANGKFNVYSQDSLSNTVNIDTVEPPNQNIDILFNHLDLPIIQLYFKILGTNPVEYLYATLTHDLTEARFTGDIDFFVPFSSQTNH